jgi:hypothetical protein
MHWRDRIADQFRDREELDPAEFYSLFVVATEGDRQGLDECFTIFEDEYDVPRGLLRPGDPLDLFLQPPAAKCLFGWLFSRAAIEDKSSELSYRLKRQRKRIGQAPMPKHPPATVGEYVDLWLGRD